VAANDRAHPESTETGGAARGARAGGTAQSAPPDAAQGNTANSATSQEGGRNPSPEPRNDGSPAGIANLAGAANKSTPPSNEHPGVGGRGEIALAGQADIENVGSASVAVPGARDAQCTDPAQQAGAARPTGEEPPEPAPQPVSRDVSLHLADGESSVDIRMAERAGEIRVTVHTPDRDLADSLRADLPDLVGKLRQSGFQAEAWRPAATAGLDTGRRGADGSPSQEQSPGGRKEGRQQPPPPRQSKKQWAGAWQSSLDLAQEFHK
jgi:hypothetical protein